MERLHQLTPRLASFLEQWDREYSDSIGDLDLFNAEKTCLWSADKKAHFVKAFYHCRGHFHELLWFLASYAPDPLSKQIILDNIADEISTHGVSHEKLYGFVAEAVGVDIKREYIYQDTYLPFCRRFNRGLLEWMATHEWSSQISAFAALEHLDNVDYVHGKKLAQSLGLSGKALTFFNVHIHVDHFSKVAEEILEEIWIKSPAIVEEAFSFIARHQARVWQDMSHELCHYSS